ncbi:FIMAH domain-containing protein [Pseudarthrobacter sp. NPDC058362]|uniref:FIMAH domain-containing protein n=1 Tax=Pseudarthrobacter sp. NPDC058362 TaxID=3346458 RepID=UPI0036619787
MKRAWVSAVLTATLLLTGCGQAETGLERDTARQLQARVLEITQASSQNKPEAALKALDGLEAELRAAKDSGRITEERHRSITTIATAVRADLDRAIAAAKATPRPSTTPTPQPTVPATPEATESAQSNQSDAGKSDDKKPEAPEQKGRDKD